MAAVLCFACLVGNAMGYWSRGSCEGWFQESKEVYGDRHGKYDCVNTGDAV